MFYRMILKKIFITSTTTFLLTVCTALRIDYPRNEFSMTHQQNFNQMRPTPRPQNSYKQQVEVVGKFKSGPGKRFPGMVVENGHMSFRPTTGDRYPHQFGGPNSGMTPYSPKSPSFPTDFGDTNVFPPKTPGFPTNLEDSNIFSPKTPNSAMSFGNPSPKTPRFGDSHRFTPKTPSGFGSTNANESPRSPNFSPNFGDPNSFSPSFPSDSDKDCDKDHQPPMLHPKHAEELKSRLQFSNFGRQNRQLISEGNFQNSFKNQQKSYKDVFGKSFENSRMPNQFSGDFHGNEGSDVLSGYPGSDNGDFSSDVFGKDGFKSDDFPDKYGGQADYVPKYDGHNNKKYESNYATGYFHNAHTYYKLF